MKELVLDASFALCWCFEDEATRQELNCCLRRSRTRRGQPGFPASGGTKCCRGLGKGVARGRLNREKAFLFWQELQELPVGIVDVPADDKLLELALRHNLAVYDASYLSLAQTRGLPIATVDGKFLCWPG